MGSTRTMYAVKDCQGVYLPGILSRLIGDPDKSATLHPPDGSTQYDAWNCGCHHTRYTNINHSPAIIDVATFCDEHEQMVKPVFDVAMKQEGDGQHAA